MNSISFRSSLECFGAIKMKILAFGDTHGNITLLNRVVAKAKKSGVDIVICAGDLSMFSHKLGRLVKILSKCKKAILLHGNHESPKEMRAICSHYPNIVFLHKKSHRMGKYLFLAYGGGGFSRKDRSFESSAARLSPKIKEGDEVVFITHAPPYNTKLDLVYGNHVGNLSIRKFIEQAKPQLVICGHIHECENKMQVLGKTLMINPGHDGKILEL